MVNLTQIFDICKLDGSLLISLIDTHYTDSELVFDQFGKAGKGNCIKLYEYQKEWYLKNYNPTLYPVPDGNIKTQIIHLTNHLQGWDRILGQVEILRSLGISVPLKRQKSTVAIQGSQRQIPTQKATATKPTQSPKSVITIKTCPFGEEKESGLIWNRLGLAVYEYFEKKCGLFGKIADGLFEVFGVEPVAFKTVDTGQKKFGFKYSPNDFAFTYKYQGSTKLKQPKSRDYKNTWIQKSGDWCAGLDFVLGGMGDTCLICGGEEDAICIISNLIDCGVVAVAVGSETKPIDSSVVSQLKAKYKNVVICFDCDSTGIDNAIKNSSRLNIPFLDLSGRVGSQYLLPSETIKDVCNIFQAVPRSIFIDILLQAIEEAAQ